MQSRQQHIMNHTVSTCQLLEFEGRLESLTMLKIHSTR